MKGGREDLGCFSRERSWRGDAALLLPGPLGRFVVVVDAAAALWVLLKSRQLQTKAGSSRMWKR